jgi:hypothetical protein
LKGYQDIVELTKFNLKDVHSIDLNSSNIVPWGRIWESSWKKYKKTGKHLSFNGNPRHGARGLYEGRIVKGLLNSDRADEAKKLSKGYKKLIDDYKVRVIKKREEIVKDYDKEIQRYINPIDTLSQGKVNRVIAKKYNLIHGCLSTFNDKVKNASEIVPRLIKWVGLKSKYKGYQNRNRKLLAKCMIKHRRKAIAKKQFGSTSSIDRTVKREMEQKGFVVSNHSFHPIRVKNKIVRSLGKQICSIVWNKGKTMKNSKSMRKISESVRKTKLKKGYNQRIWVKDKNGKPVLRDWKFYKNKKKSKKIRYCGHGTQTPWNKGKKNSQIPWNKGKKLGFRPWNFKLRSKKVA